MEGINLKRFIICLVLGTVAGIFCAVATSLLNPGVSAIYIFHIVFMRAILGLVLGLIGTVVLLDNELVNPIVRGAIMGLILSIPMLMVPVATATNYLIAGPLFGALIDLVATKLE